MIDVVALRCFECIEGKAVRSLIYLIVAYDILRQLGGDRGSEMPRAGVGTTAMPLKQCAEQLKQCSVSHPVDRATDSTSDAVFKGEEAAASPPLHCAAVSLAHDRQIAAGARTNAKRSASAIATHGDQWLAPSGEHPLRRVARVTRDLDLLGSSASSPSSSASSTCSSSGTRATIGTPQPSSLEHLGLAPPPRAILSVEDPLNAAIGRRGGSGGGGVIPGPPGGWGWMLIVDADLEEREGCAAAPDDGSDPQDRPYGRSDDLTLRATTRRHSSVRDVDAEGSFFAGLTDAAGPTQTATAARRSGALDVSSRLPRRDGDAAKSTDLLASMAALPVPM